MKIAVLAGGHGCLRSIDKSLDTPGGDFPRQALAGLGRAVRRRRRVLDSRRARADRLDEPAFHRCGGPAADGSAHGPAATPNAWSQAPLWQTNHLVGNVIVEAISDTQAEVWSSFLMMELRRDSVRHFGGSYRHSLMRAGDGWRIRLQRVDLMNGQAAFDYVIQAWV